LALSEAYNIRVAWSREILSKVLVLESLLVDAPLAHEDVQSGRPSRARTVIDHTPS
jgi:hypothetical protein